MTKLNTIAGFALLALSLAGAASAQAPGPLGPETVSWTVTPSADTVKGGGKLTLTLHGAVQAGWHIYGLKQLPEGPTPLVVGLAANDVAKADGAATGSPPTKIHDPAFDLETQFYAGAFTLAVPVRIAPHSAGGKQVIPVNVRFQSCNGGICLPPKTVRLSAAINVKAEG